jgi:hypothetical protein
MPYVADTASADYSDGNREVRRIIIRVIRGGNGTFHKARFSAGRVEFDGAHFAAGEVSFENAVHQGSSPPSKVHAHRWNRRLACLDGGFVRADGSGRRSSSSRTNGCAADPPNVTSIGW